ncbi:putative acylpyruvase FAHD1 mitochondrial [Bienertia sinuspersici]
MGSKEYSSRLWMANLIKQGTKSIGVGRNYVGRNPTPMPKEPILFLKPTSSYLANGGTIEIPASMEHLWYEAELAVVIGKKARDVSESEGLDYAVGYALGLDMTAMELQATTKGLPWLLAKGLDTFTPISGMISKDVVPDPHNLELWLKVDAELKQKGPTSDTIFKVPYLISHISTFMTLVEGDVILICTVEGIRPVKPGQKITAGITGLMHIHLDAEKRSTPVSNLSVII